MYEVFEHTADIGLRIAAPTWEALLVEAARGLFSLIVAEADSVRPLQRRRLEVPGQNRDYLLFDWLNELLFMFESEKLLLMDFQVTTTPTGIVAEVCGEPRSERHRLEHEVKAITYHGLKIEQVGQHLVAEVIVDI